MARLLNAAEVCVMRSFPGSRVCMRYVFPFALVHLVLNAPAMADDCQMQIKNCIQSSVELVDVRVYDGDDSAHFVAASEEIGFPYLSSQTFFCHHTVCDVKIDLRPGGGPVTHYLMEYDQCHDITLTKDSAGFHNIAPRINNC